MSMETTMKYKPYPAYKESGVEWLGEVPAGWNVIPIRGLARQGTDSFIDGDWIEAPFIADDGIRLIQTGNIGVGYYKEQGFRYISDDTFRLLKCTDIEPGNVLICRLAEPVGRACIAPDLGIRMITSVDVCILKTKDDIDARFIVYLMSSQPYLGFMESQCRGGTRDRVSRSFLGSVRVVFPIKQEQVFISDFLDRETAKIDTLIAKQERLIELLGEKRTALISHAVTKGLNPDAAMKDSGVEWLGEVPEHWEVSGITKYLESVVDYRGRTPTKVDEGVFLLTARNIRNGIIDYNASQEFIAVDEYEEVMRRGKPAIGDLLFTTEAPLGQVANIDIVDIALAQRVIKFRGKVGILDNYFLKYWIMGRFCQSDLEQLATGSTALGIKGSKVGQVRLCLPPYEEQDKIVQFLDKKTAKIDTLITKARHATDLLKERRTALISAAVTGKIDVREVIH